MRAGFLKATLNAEVDEEGRSDESEGAGAREAEQPDRADLGEIRRSAEDCPEYRFLTSSRRRSGLTSGHLPLARRPSRRAPAAARDLRRGPSPPLSACRAARWRVGASPGRRRRAVRCPADLTEVLGQLGVRRRPGRRRSGRTGGPRVDASSLSSRASPRHGAARQRVFPTDVQGAVPMVFTALFRQGIKAAGQRVGTVFLIAELAVADGTGAREDLLTRSSSYARPFATTAPSEGQIDVPGGDLRRGGEGRHQRL